MATFGSQNIWWLWFEVKFYLVTSVERNGKKGQIYENVLAEQSYKWCTLTEAGQTQMVTWYTYIYL